MTMSRSDRRNSNFDNNVRHPRSHQREPVSTHESKQLVITLRAQKNEFQQKAEDAEKKVEEKQQQYLEEQQKYQSALTLYQGEQQKYQSALTLYQEEQQKHQSALTLYQGEQQKYQSALTLYQEEQQKYQSTLTLYQEEQQKYQSTLTLYQEANEKSQSYLSLYDQEKSRGDELLIKIETVESERNKYLTLYNQSQSDLNFERRSKAGIKGWETRRKRENERLKKEIGEMTIILRDAILRKEDAIDNLEALAHRMDRIQNLVDSVDKDTVNTPVGLLQKFQRIWQAIQDILAE